MVDISGHIWGPLEILGVIAVAVIVTTSTAVAILIFKATRRPQPQPQQQGPLPSVAAIRAIFTRMGPSVTARDIESGLIALESVGVRGAAPVTNEQHQHQHQNQNQNHDKQEQRAPTVAVKSTRA